jgi:hypothetical protein
MASVKRIVVGICCWPVLAITIAGVAAESAPRVSSDREVKAVFIFQFSQFVVWPPGAIAGPNEPFVIGILGRDPIEEILVNLVRGERVGTRTIAVRRLQDATEARGCQIVYVAAGTERELIAAQLRAQPVLTVGESNAFSEAGGIIRFVVDRNRVRMRINANSAAESGLVISSKLLRVAEKIGP